MRDTTMAALALLALAACGAAWAGEGNSGTDRGKQAKYTPVICRTGENLVAVPQADGSLQWTCASTSVSSPAPQAG
ncbi:MULTISPECIES: hypothetical protein [Lysobacter]|uniref:Lipoprotein n=2 Tax=Lysobacter TaxID=68 RepID=A0A0S2DK49_LYSEN|nr:MULTISPECIES: hypothetical protein [Lysobacter]ALN58785.1 lipoprotein [Lysobacter enzymogenes]QQQ02994.1 hypothetical protein JHW41_08550 [Lysobacter enzymogenes]WMT01392.1 hypothetical protein RDV84_15490 [Lysobacter yananisis]